MIFPLSPINHPNKMTFVMRQMFALLMFPLAAAGAESVSTELIGFNKVTCLPASDTVVGVPFRQQGSRELHLVHAPVNDVDHPGQVTLTVDATDLPPGGLNSHYLKFSSGALLGRWFALIGDAVTSNTLTLDTNGDDFGGVVAGDSAVLAEYSTLDSLFPPVRATTSWSESVNEPGDWIANGHAIMASTGTSPLARRTELLVPDLAGEGINLIPAGTHFINGGATPGWLRALPGGGFAPSGDTVLHPDAYFVIRHSQRVSRPTIFRSLGEVETSERAIPLFSSASVRQDNHIAIPRPVALTLGELGLAGTPAFVSSASFSPLARRDELLVFDNTIAMRNRTPSGVYFVVNGGWHKWSNGIATAADEDIISAGHGIIIRKARTAGGHTEFWENPSGY